VLRVSVFPKQSQICKRDCSVCHVHINIIIQIILFSHELELFLGVLICPAYTRIRTQGYFCVCEKNQMGDVLMVTKISKRDGRIEKYQPEKIPGQYLKLQLPAEEVILAVLKNLPPGK